MDLFDAWPWSEGSADDNNKSSDAPADAEEARLTVCVCSVPVCVGVLGPTRRRQEDFPPPQLYAHIA